MRVATILEQVKQAIIDGDEDAAQAHAGDALLQGINPLAVVKEAIVPGIERTGELWKENVYFMPDVVLSTEAFKAAMNVVAPQLAALTADSRGRYVMGVVAGDMHDLGKNIVAAMLTGAGFEVIDLGVDVPTPTFIEKVKELKPDILGVGCYMTTTMLELRGVMKGLSDNGLRGSLKVMVGGVPTTQSFADEVGADAWGKDALDAVEKARWLMEK
jgi:corrinoid protein of di/trimethylamine methyltransferase